MERFDKETFIELWEDESKASKVALWNLYARECQEDDEIYYNDEDFFNTFFSSPIEAVRACYFGDYTFSHEFVWFNGYGNLDSADRIDDMPIDLENLCGWLEDNTDALEGNFADALVDDEEEEEDEE